jgi:hypothetical protein
VKLIGEKINGYGSFVRNVNETDNLEIMGIDYRITLKLFLKSK